MKKVLNTLLLAAFSFCAMAGTQQNTSGKTDGPGAEYIRLNSGIVILISKK